MRVITLTRHWTDGGNVQDLLAGFDQEASAVIMARLLSSKMEAEEEFNEQHEKVGGHHCMAMRPGGDEFTIAFVLRRSDKESLADLVTVLVKPMLEKMRKEGMTPNMISFSTAMSAAGEQTLNLLIEMHRKTLVPDDVCIVAALSAAEWSQHREPEVRALERWRLSDGIQTL